MEKEKLSIKDIASALNISKTTVSFILNGKAKEKRISDQLVKKVLAFVKEVGYVPNQLAQSLRTGKTKIIGLMIEDISNPFFANVAKQIEDKAYANGYKIIYCSTENDPKRAKTFLSMFQNLGVDGYIIAPTTGIEKEIKALLKTGANIILFDRKYGDAPVDHVMVDNKQGTYLGTKHLIEQGYSNIAFITVSLEPIEKNERISGYIQAIEENGLVNHLYTLTYSNDHDYSKDIAAILRTNSSLDAIIFGTNYLGIGGLEAIANMGLKIPDNLAVLSFDDNDLFRLYSPSISAISQPIEQISETVITTLLERLSASGESPKAKNHKAISLPTSLIQRESTQKKMH